jgi:hypothetical protein
MKDNHTADRADGSAGATKKRSPLRHILALLLAVLVLSALFFLFRDRLHGGTLFSRRPAGSAEAFTYESGTDQVFAVAGDGLAVASGSALQLLDAAGGAVWKQVVSYAEPAVFAAEDRVLFCDIGRRSAVLVTLEGESFPLEVSGGIITASMNKNGWYALVTEAAGYKGVVRVYNGARELRYEWWSGSGYVLRAALSPDNRILAVLCADGSGGVLHFFSLDSENELASAEFPQELAFDLAFLGDGTVCCVSAEALHFVGTDGAEQGVYDLGDYVLMDYDLGSENFVPLFVSAYRAGTGGFLLTLDRAGRLLGSAELGENVGSLCARGKQLLLMTGGGLTLYSPELAVQQRAEMVVTARRALLRPSGVLLLSAYAAEPFQF